jgi:hypothetical protein
MSNKPNDKKAFNITMSDIDEEVLVVNQIFN